MKLMTLVVCLGLSACATDYASQLAEPGYGIRSLHYTESDMDPAMLMNGGYASKKMNGLYAPSVACLAGYRCWQPAQPAPSGWDP